MSPKFILHLVCMAVVITRTCLALSYLRPLLRESNPRGPFSKITKTTNISSFCKIQHLKYIAHVTRLENSSLQKQLLFSSTQKKYARDPWIKAEKDLNISKMQIQKTMQNKTEFMSLLHHVYNN